MERFSRFAWASGLRKWQDQTLSDSDAFQTTPGGFGSFVRARNFFKRNAIPPEETLAFRKPAITAEGILVLDLN